MNLFLKAAFGVLKVMVPAIGSVEEAVKDLKAGNKKKEAVIKIVTSAPIIAEMLSGKEIINETLFNQGVNELNDALVKIMNATKKQ